jgi:hypothetical protein
MNYDFTKVSGQSFLLPLKSEIHSREGKFLVKNEVEFSSTTASEPNRISSSATSRTRCWKTAPRNSR